MPSTLPIILTLAFVSFMQFRTPKDPVALQAINSPQESGGSTSDDQKPRAGIQMLTDTEGVNFNEFLRTLYLSIKRRWDRDTPMAVWLGQQGRNSVQFRVMRDGKVPENFIKLVYSSDNKNLDDASLNAIRKASPFSPLPKEFSQPFIELRLTFYYNYKK
jgi:TonB family protein